MRASLAATAAIAALALAGCSSGSDSSGTGSELDGPSQVVPADFPVYVEATVNPEGQQQADLEDLAGQLGDLPIIGQVGNPGDLIVQQLDAAAAQTGLDFSFSDDIQPWLGEKLGIGFTQFEDGQNPSFVAALETTDENATRAALDKILASDAVDNPKESYAGVDYFTTPDGAYDVGVFDGHLVLATVDEFENAVDVSQGNADSLASSDRLASSLGTLDPNRLGSVYVDLSQIDQFASTPQDADNLAKAKEALPTFFEGGFAFGVGATADQVYAESSAPLLDGQPELGASPLLGAAPGDSTAAYAVADLGSIGPFLQGFFENLQAAGVPLHDYPDGGLSAVFERATGVTLDAASAALGDGVIWLRGDLPDNFEVAGKLEVSDPETATAVLDAAKKAADTGVADVGPPLGGNDAGFSVQDTRSDSPLGFANFELVGDAVTFGFFTDRAAAEAANPEGAGSFSASDAYSSAPALLGDGYDLAGAVDLGPILDAFVASPSVPDAILGGGSPGDLIKGFVANKLKTVAIGQRYADGYAVQRYSLGIGG